MASPLLGAGQFPAGSGLAGFGVPATVSPTGASLLPQTNGFQGTGRLIDVTKGDYVLDWNGNLLGMPSAAQLVMEVTAGIPVRRTLSPSDLSAMVADLQAALLPLVQRGIIKLKSVTVTRDPNNSTRVLRSVQWVDTVTSADQTTVI